MEPKSSLKTYIENRPWGNFEQFTHNESTTVKIITVNAGGELSLQYHVKRSEFWKVLSGEPTITSGDKIIQAKPGDEFFQLAKQNHRIAAGAVETKILEIAFGDFDEADIVRIEDKYGRK